MLATEARRVFKDGAVIFIVLAALVAGIRFSDQDVFLAPALEIFLLLYAAFTGWSLFERERQENAGEYMLSLPLSRSRLLLLKFLPRLLAVSLLLLLYLHLHRSWQFPSFLSPADFSVLYAGFFLLATAFSISFKNFISAFFIICLLDIGQVLLIKLLDGGRDTGQAILQASAAGLLFPLLFLILFQRYDIRPLSHFNRRFFPGMLLLTALIAGYLLLSAPAGMKNYYLNSGGSILKNSCRLSEIRVPQGLRRFPGCLIALRETADGRTLYCLTREPRKDEPCAEMSLGALDLKTGDLKTLYEFEADWFIAGGHVGEIGSSRGRTYSLFLQNPKQKKAMLLQVQDGVARKIPIAGGFYDPDIQYVFYLEGAPPRFIIFSKPRVYRLDASGGTTELASARYFSVWRDRILLFGPAGLNLYQAGNELTPLLQRQGNFKKTARRIGGYESRGVIYHAGRDYFWLDMESQKESPLEVKSGPYTYQHSGNSFHVVFANGSVFTIRGIRPDGESETVWSPGFQPSGIRISPFGLLVFRDQRYKVYRFNQ
jgi:hypothetical protein